MDSSDLSKWDPLAPHGFFLIEIGFTEDGAEALFAKEVKAESMEGEQMLLTVNQTIQVTNLSKTTIYRMFDSGELKKVKLGGSTRVELSKELYEKYKEKIQALF
jgi:excisionase family DNA binding protein